MYRMVTIVNNALFLKVAKRVDLRSSHDKKKVLMTRKKSL